MNIYERNLLFLPYHPEIESHKYITVEKQVILIVEQT